MAPLWRYVPAVDLGERNSVGLDEHKSVDLMSTALWNWINTKVWAWMSKVRVWMKQSKHWTDRGGNAVGVTADFRTACHERVPRFLAHSTPAQNQPAHVHAQSQPEAKTIQALSRLHVSTPPRLLPSLTTRALRATQISPRLSTSTQIRGRTIHQWHASLIRSPRGRC
jgi:hypothetical protein